jgi:hypothetical protein
MASLPFAEKGGEFAKDGVSSSAQNRGRTTGEGGTARMWLNLFEPTRTPCPIYERF